MADELGDKYLVTLNTLLTTDRMTETYMQVVREMKELHDKKSKDYNNEVPFTEYFPELCRDLFITLRGKMLRLQSLVGREGGVAVPNFESIQDNARDLAAYAVWMSVLADIQEEETIKKKVQND